MPFEFIGHPAWRNTLSQDTVNRDITRIGCLQDMAMAAFNVNYPYICWNDRVYAVHMGADGHLDIRDTNLLKEDVL